MAVDNVVTVVIVVAAGIIASVVIVAVVVILVFSWTHSPHCQCGHIVGAFFLWHPGWFWGGNGP